MRKEEFPIHAEFKEMVAKAQKHADKKKGPVEVSWRGYTMTVKPNLPTFTEYDLDTILLQAVDTLVEMEKKEKKKEEEEAKKNKTADDLDDLDDVFAVSDNENQSYKLSTKKVKARKVNTIK